MKTPMARSQSTGTTKTPKKASSTTGRKKTSQTTSARTAKNLSQKLKTLTTLDSLSKTPSKKSSIKANKAAKTPVKSSGKTKKTNDSLAYSSDLQLFPYVDTFPYRLEDKSENKTCYFQTESHARKYIERYHPEYKLYCYTR